MKSNVPSPKDDIAESPRISAQSPFRSIRQTLFNEGKLVRYLGYAIGEIALIIIGIMMALELNNWNEDRKAQVEFDEYITHLRDDVRTGIEIALAGSVAADSRTQQVLTVLRYLKGVDLPIDEEAFEEALNQLGRYHIRDIGSGYLTQLLEGDISDIIQDKELADSVLSLNKKIKNDQQVMVENAELQKLSLETFSRYRGIASSLSEEFSMKYDLRQLKESDEFEIAALNMIYFLSEAKFRQGRIRNELESFLTVLEEYE